MPSFTHFGASPPHAQPPRHAPFSSPWAVHDRAAAAARAVRRRILRALLILAIPLVAFVASWRLADAVGQQRLTATIEASRPAIAEHERQLAELNRILVERARFAQTRQDALRVLEQSIREDREEAELARRELAALAPRIEELQTELPALQTRIDELVRDGEEIGLRLELIIRENDELARTRLELSQSVQERTQVLSEAQTKRDAERDLSRFRGGAR